MRILILVSLLLIGCDQSMDVKNNGNDNRLLGSLVWISNSGNSNNVTNVTNTTTTSGGTVTASGGNVSYTVGGVTYTAPANSTNSSSVSSQIAKFLAGTFIMETADVPRDSTVVNYYENTNACVKVGYRPVTIVEFKLFVELIEYARLNYNKVPTYWMKLYDRFQYTDGVTFWVTDRDGLYSDELAYKLSLRRAYSFAMYAGSFYYAGERMDNVYNKNSRVGSTSLLCYKIN